MLGKSRRSFAQSAATLRHELRAHPYLHAPGRRTGNQPAGVRPSFPRKYCIPGCAPRV